MPSPAAPRVLLVGSPGRAPFAGHFRGARAHGAARLAWAGRLRPGADPEEGWAAAEEARAALAGLAGADRYALIQAAWAALGPLDRGDLSVLLVGTDGDGVAVAGCGLATVLADGRPLVAPGHPLLGEPGIPERTGFLNAEATADTYVGAPAGTAVPSGDVEAACGVRAWG